MSEAGPSESSQPARRRIFIGDIQGCLGELESLLEKVDYRRGRDELHPVGDLINRGPDSLGVLRLLRQEGAGGVLGNHDVHALRVAAGMRRSGGRDTLDELLGTREGRTALEWLAQRPFVRAWPDVVCVHAALNPSWTDPLAALAGKDPLEPDPDTDFVTRVRYCTSVGERPESDWPPPGAPYEAWFHHFRKRPHDAPTLVFGHWARLGLVVEPGIRGLDSACVWGGALSAWIAEEDMIVQVQAVRAWSSP